MNYYDEIASGYDELHSDEQLKKLAIIKKYFSPNREEKLLDVGCGTGVSSSWDCQVYAVDPSDGLLDIFRSRVGLEKDSDGKILNDGEVVLHIKQASAEKLPFSDTFFDYVISLTAIQNFDDIGKGLREIKRVGKNKFALSFLKRSSRKDEILDLMKNVFGNLKIVEEEKDIIVIID